jgi:putative phosphoribosyl transferase
MIFRDRRQAGNFLANKLGAYGGDPTAVVLGLPRGGVVVGYEISRALRVPLDVLIARKLSMPDNPEYAIGAVSEPNAVYLNPDAVEAFRLSPADLDRFIQAQHQEIARRQHLYRQGRSLPELADRTVILVDDGIATGSTFFAAIEGVAAHSPRRVVAAIPVGPRETLAHVVSRVNELVVLDMPDPFSAVGQAYEDFAQVTDDQVIEILKLAHGPLIRHPAS